MTTTLHTPIGSGSDATTAPCTAESAAFRAAHGDPATWSAEDFEVYLDLERVGAPAGGDAA